MNKSAVKDVTPQKKFLNTSPKKSVRSVHDKVEKVDESSIYRLKYHLELQRRVFKLHKLTIITIGIENSQNQESL